MKPTYTVRLTGDLGPDERQRIAARVAGVTEIGADKIERLLERGAGRDLIKPSSANVANRLASVLAEAGAPVRLTPVAESESAPPEAVEPDRATPPTGDGDVLRPRQHGQGREASGEPNATPPAEAVEPPSERAGPEDAELPPEPRVEPVAAGGEPPAEQDAARPTDADAEPAEVDRSPTADRPVAAQTTDVPPPATGAEAPLPEPEPDGAPDEEPAGPPEPEVTVTPPADPGVRARPDDPEREPPPPPRTVTPPPRAPRANGGSAVLGAIGAAVLGIGAVFAMDLLVNPIAIGVLVLAVLALALSLLGQRRATWLPGLGALALLVWALANAGSGPMATLAANWQWYAMFAGSLLVIVAGFQEAQRGRAR